MKCSCLINNHNYRKFVGEAIRSVLDQSRPFDEIIVVDDGSTDGSCEFIERQFAAHPQVHLLRKPQGGQLSCFHRGMDRLTGDIVFFLDADDRYRPEYLATAAELYESRPEVDFLSVNYRDFGGTRRLRRRHRPTQFRGSSVLATLLRSTWVGMPTSCLSMRAALLRNILPYPFESAWITRADDVLIFATSVLGAGKYHLENHLVDYRLHDSNRFARRELTATQKMQYALRVNQLLTWYTERAGYDRTQLPRLLHREFRTWERPSLREMHSYLQMSWRAPLPMAIRIEHWAAILWHTARERFQRRAPQPSQPVAAETNRVRKQAA